MNRRRFLRTAGSNGILLLSATALGGCAQGLPQLRRAGGSTGGNEKFALILPQSGEFAELGQAMLNAARLVPSGTGNSDDFQVFDAGDSDASAAEAAKGAAAAGASVLFGPLRSAQTLAVLAAAGRVPVVTFSNDASLSAQGAYVMGLTAQQSVLTMFTFAKAQGLGRLAVVAAPTPFGEASAIAAVEVARSGGLELAPPLLRDPKAAGLVNELRSRSGGTLPDAVYIPDAGDRLAGFARSLAGSGVQLLGSAQWTAGDLVGRSDLFGAAFAAPSPTVFDPFSGQYEAAYGVAPGAVAALAYDAVLIGRGMISAGELDERGLQRTGGFSGVLGPFRFDRDGRCFRDLAVLAVGQQQIEVVAEVAEV